MLLSDFNFYLPKELIAKHPLYPRGSSRLMYLDNKGDVCDYKFQDIIKLLRSGDVLVLNDSKVIPAYITGIVKSLDGKEKLVVVYLNKKLSENEWNAFAKPQKFIQIGGEVLFSKNLHAKVISKDRDSGEIKLCFNVSGEELWENIHEIGQMPIPPYFKRKPEKSDDMDYQTVFAKESGSVAAPTAGLHFDEAMLLRIKKIGVKIVYVTLHVGSGTFLPVKTEEIASHKMHTEEFSISKKTVDIINKCKEKGEGRVVCVGTTSLRAIEGSDSVGGKLQSQTGQTNIFITPGFKFKFVDSLITNFHTPKSTLFMLVSSFSGMDNIRRAYEHAIRQKYRFFSYGDACWLDINDVL